MEAVFSLLCIGVCVGLTALLVVGIVMLVRHQRALYRKKVANLYGWARAYGWTYQETEQTLPNRFQGHPFGQGGQRRALHVLYGNHRDHRVVGFEYQYTVSNGNNGNTTHQYTVVTVPTPAPRPYLQVTHEHGGHRLLELVGIRDLQLESEEFNRAFRISAGDDKFAYDVLHPRMMEWLLADQRARRTPFRLEQNVVLCWMRGELDPRNVVWMADYLVDVLERVPAFVWK